MNERLKILPPWTIVTRKLEALFDGDPQIAFNVDYSGMHPAVILACNNGDKVAALQKILPTEIEFGNVKMEIVVDGTPSNIAFTSKVDLFDAAFKGIERCIDALICATKQKASSRHNWHKLDS